MKTVLSDISLAPYIDQAQVLIHKSRKVGGNMFRHQGATLFILFDYGHFDPVLLKAAVIHDLFEDVPHTDRDAIAGIDADGPAVVRLVLEVTRREGESKEAFLERILTEGSANARLLKCADRISNLVDLSSDVYGPLKTSEVLDHTVRFVIPMAEAADHRMAVELRDLVTARQGRTGL
jgi:(p)ppGpp synthase/HD superfamily hydrolase